MLVLIQATVTRKTGQWTVCKQIPTLYLEAESEAGAEYIARKMLVDLGLPGDVINLGSAEANNITGD